MTICERMFDLIEKTKGKSAAGLCKEIGVGTSQTSSWKQRNTDPPAKYLTQICEYLGVSLEYLLTGEEKQQGDDGLSKAEEWVIERFRALDEDGVIAVRGVVLNEYRRVMAEKGDGTEQAG